MEYSGYAPEWDEVAFRGSPEQREFVAFWLHGRRVVAGMNVNVWGVAEVVQELVASGRIVDPVKLTDPGIPLDDTDRIAA
jgi:3-phenylpropionate/trans-cinnamate dioxygenase ferredoxin reductase component